MKIDTEMLAPLCEGMDGGSEVPALIAEAALVLHEAIYIDDDGIAYATASAIDFALALTIAGADANRHRTPADQMLARLNYIIDELSKFRDNVRARRTVKIGPLDVQPAKEGA